MKTLFLLLTLTCSFVVKAQNVFLPKPDTLGGMTLMKALNERASSRDFIDSSLTPKQTSSLLWAAFGINRKESGKRTAPTAMNCQEFDIYLADKNGIYVYQPDSNMLKLVVSGDFRLEMGKQAFVKKASLVLIFVADYSKMKNMSQEDKDFYSAADCGFISQNVYLFSASESLSTVVLGWIDREKMSQRLKLNETQKIIFSQPVGFGIKK